MLLKVGSQIGSYWRSLLKSTTNLQHSQEVHQKIHVQISFSKMLRAQGFISPSSFGKITCRPDLAATSPQIFEHHCCSNYSSLQVEDWLQVVLKASAISLQQPPSNHNQFSASSQIVKPKLSLSATHRSVTGRITQTTRAFSTAETVSVRKPHGEGVESLPRIDTDQAAANSNAKSLTSILEGSKKKKVFTPSAPPPTNEQIQALHDFIVECEKLVIITGAGVSTESGIPDYRSPTGAYSTGFKPMTHQEFVRSAKSRQRYWARSYFGWRQFFGSQPNETHRALATLEERGRVHGGMMTQNVDRLHHACGSRPLELHGTTHEVVCMSCQNISDRQQFQEKLASMNPQWIDSIQAAERGDDVLAGTPGLQRPDGDVEIGEEFLRKGLFKVPKCENCGADALKPNVVFFGDNVPKARVDQAMAMVQNSDAILVVGSSLMVLSAFRLARAAADKKSPIAILNVGPTRADELAALRVGARSGEVLARLLHHGSLALPL